MTAFEDLRDERGRMGELKGATDAAARNFLIFHLGENARISLRPSGTEPKAKAYVEACCAPCPHGLSDADWQKVSGTVTIIGNQARLTDLAPATGQRFYRVVLLP